MEWYEAEVRELVERLAANHVAEPVVFYGSSSIRLWTTLAHDVRSERAVNAGFGGSTLEACAHFFDRIVAPLKPTSLVVYAGDNDLGDGRSPDDVLASYRRLAGSVEHCCGAIPFAYLSIKPSPARIGILDRIRRANELVRIDHERLALGTYVDVFDAMLRDGAPRSELYLDDGLHLSAAGYDLWTKLLEPYRARVFPTGEEAGVATPQAAT
jgi:lysophospholipase L1-like esterase